MDYLSKRHSRLIHMRAKSSDDSSDLESLTSKPSFASSEDLSLSRSNTKLLKILGVEDKMKSKEKLPNIEDSEIFSESDTESNSNNSQGVPAPESLENNAEELYIATRSHKGHDDFEISFEKNAFLLVTNKKSEDLWKVEMKGIVGYVRPSLLKRVSLSNQDEIVKKCKTQGSKGVTPYKVKIHKCVSKEGFTAGGRVWRQVKLPDGRVYYYCPDTYETCNEIPLIDGEQLYSWYEEVIPGQKEWRMIENNGLFYYYNEKTRKTAWNLPT